MLPHPPKDQQTEDFDCWVLHWFIHIPEEGDESASFDKPTGSGGNVEEVIEVAEVIANNKSESTELENSNNNVLAEIAELLERHMASGATTINTEDAWLTWNLFPDMVEDDNQPWPENILTMAEHQASNPPEFFGGWEHSGSCHRCLNGDRKNKALLNFHHEVSPTIQQLFGCFFKEFIVGMIVPAIC